MCARRVSQWRNVSGAFRRRFPVRVSCRRLRASILHRHGPLLPTEVLRHVPGPQTEVPLVHLVNVSSSEVEISICDLRTLTLCSDFCYFLPSFCSIFFSFCLRLSPSSCTQTQIHNHCSLILSSLPLKESLASLL